MAAVAPRTQLFTTDDPFVTERRLNLAAKVLYSHLDDVSTKRKHYVESPIFTYLKEDVERKPERQGLVQLTVRMAEICEDLFREGSVGIEATKSVLSGAPQSFLIHLKSIRFIEKNSDLDNAITGYLHFIENKKDFSGVLDKINYIKEILMKEEDEIGHILATSSSYIR